MLKYDSVAQLVEHYTFNVVVLGSNPSGITRFSIKMPQNPANQMIVGFLFLKSFQKYSNNRIKKVSDSVSNLEL